MILLDMKNGKTVSSPLNLSTSKDKPLLSFSDLLRGASEKKEAKTVQNGSLVLALSGEDKNIKPAKTLLKTDNLSSILKSEDKLSLNKEQELSELNPKLTQNLTSSEIKTLIADAKNYLKEKIQNSDDYKNSKIKELPKTLSALVEVAKNLGIDISKISVEEVKTSPDSKVKNEISTKALTDAKDNFLSKEAVSDKKALQVNEKQVATIIANNTQITQEQSLNEIKKEENSIEAQKETPLFKAQSVSEHTTTEQIVQTKANNLLKVDQKTSKDKSDETLKLLLRDEKLSTGDILSSADFSAVAAVKPDISGKAQESVKTLEQLLQGESSVAEQNQTTSKAEVLTTHKADSFEVKINEAKQMIRYLSDDVKNAIDEYKSPFTRVKVQLNPAHLGEVDLTIVQRGKNLHVNLSSNNAAINALAMNANELRVQLNNSGINNATLNFSDNSQQSFTDNSGQNQQRQNEQKAHHEYNFFENEELHEEILSSLEIIVPRYI